jgi:chitinase
MGNDPNACDGHLGEPCGWTSTNDGQGYTCQTVSWGTGCEPAGIVCPALDAGSGPSDGGSLLVDAGSVNDAGPETSDGGTEPTSSGRIIGYLPGWLTPPTAQSLASAGYTNILVAFAVFSTTSPGELVSAFSTVTAGDIAQMQAAGIKVSLSIGGASTSLANTSTDFDQVLSAASSAAAFEQTFVASVQSFVSQYGFDGIDIDIEQGLIPAGTFTQPTGDIAVLATILDQVHAADPSLLISLVPQSPNVSATSDFNDTFGNYSSLILQTYPELSWVGIQLYNSGCNLGIDTVCYGPNNTTSPNFSVAMAVDLLTSWPSTTSGGQATGFQPYVNHLSPGQVVLGYPAPNKSGVADGSPITPTSTIKRAIQCLETGGIGNSSCGSYVPPRAYPNMGGVFDWQVANDESNNFAFATQLGPCVMSGTCQ